MDSSSEGTTTNSLYASLLEDSSPEHSLPPYKVNPPMNPRLGAIGEERRELGNIRRFFGYCPQDFLSYGDLGKNLPNSEMKDILFLSVYICPYTIADQGYFDLGVSVFDTRYLHNGMKALRDDLAWPMAAVQSYHFRLIKSERGPQPPDDRFHFGSSTIIEPEQLPACLADIVRDRDYAVVVSNPHSYVQSLESWGLGLGFDPLCSLDIVSAYNMVMKTSHGDLGDLMSDMGLFHRDTYHPGNAAHYNLRAFIGLATLDAAKNQWPWLSDLMWHMTFLSNTPEAMFTDGFGADWVDSFFRAHRDAVADRKVEAKTKHPNTSRKMCRCNYRRWLRATGQLFDGQGNYV